MPWLWLRVFASRFRGLFDRNHAEYDLEEELRSHLEMEIAANLARGLAPEEARRAALRDFARCRPP